MAANVDERRTIGIFRAQKPALDAKVKIFTLQDAPVTRVCRCCPRPIAKDLAQWIYV